MHTKRRPSLKSPVNRNSLFIKRIGALQKKMAEAHFDACIIELPVQLLYLIGMQLSAGVLIIHRADAHLFIDGRYLTAAAAQCPIDASLYQEEDVASFLRRGKVKKLGFDSEQTSYDRVMALEAFLKTHRLKVALIASGAFFKEIRAVKDAAEIAKLRASARLLYRGFESMRRMLRVGVTEKEIAQAFEIFCLKEGAEKMAFDPIIAFGANSALPHYRAGKTKLRKGDPVLIDIGVVFNQYHSDMTRMLFFQTIDPFLGRVYEVVRQAQAAALAMVKPGVCVGAVDEAARVVMRRYEMESAFVHSLGHGIGLETHEFPRIKSGQGSEHVILEAGMVVTIEPGLYFPGRGGVRYEDTVVVTTQGCRSLFPEMKKKEVIVR